MYDFSSWNSSDGWVRNDGCLSPSMTQPLHPLTVTPLSAIKKATWRCSHLGSNTLLSFANLYATFMLFAWIRSVSVRKIYHEPKNTLEQFDHNSIFSPHKEISGWNSGRTESWRVTSIPYRNTGELQMQWDKVILWCKCELLISLTLMMCCGQMTSSEYVRKNIFIPSSER